MRRLVRVTCIAVGLFASLCFAEIRTIALTGQQAPGTEAGVSFVGFRDLSIADRDTLIFTGSLNSSSTTNTGFWIYRDGALQKLARLHDPLPEGIAPTPQTWSSLVDAAINANGQVAISGGYGTTSVLLSGTAGSLSPVMASGDVAPGTGGKIFSGAPQQPLSMDDQGNIAFYGSLRFTTPLPAKSDSGLWLGRPGNVSLVARGNDPAPGTAAGTTFGSFAPIQYGIFNSYFPPALSDGKISFVNDAFFTANFANKGIWNGAPGAITKVALVSDSAPPAGSGNFTGIPIAGYNPPSSSGIYGFDMSAAGDVSFLGTTSTGLQGLWLAHNSTVQNIALSGQPAGPNSTFSSFGAPYMSASGRIAFVTSVRELGVARTVLWSWFDGQLTKVASSADDSRFERIGDDWTKFAINDSGQIAFWTRNASTIGLWGYDPLSGLHLIANLGQEVEVAPGDIRTISTISVEPGSGTGDGRSTFLNNSGEVIFRLGFTDGSSGVFISGVPEPSLGVLPLLAVLVSRRRSFGRDRNRRNRF